MIHHANDCKWWSKQEADNCNCARQEFINLYKKVEELQQTIKTLKDDAGLKIYTFKARYTAHAAYTTYEGKAVIKAYNLEEAERQFKESRWELKCNGFMNPQGKECNYDIEYGDVK